jgi:hypothetical protein
VAVAALVALASAPGCKRKPEESAARGPAAEVKPAGPAVAPGTVEPAEEEPRPAADAAEAPGPTVPEGPQFAYVHPLGTFLGPPSPPILKAENLTAEQLQQWTSVPISETHETQKFKTALDAALDTASANNEGRLIFELVAQGDLALALKQPLPPTVEYIEYLQLLGREEATQGPGELEAKLREQIQKYAGIFGSDLEPAGRKDRMVGEFRLSRWSFTYKDKQGNAASGCFLFILLENAWRLLDMECPPEDAAQK